MSVMLVVVPVCLCALVVFRWMVRRRSPRLFGLRSMPLEPRCRLFFFCFRASSSEDDELGELLQAQSQCELTWGANRPQLRMWESAARTPPMSLYFLQVFVAGVRMTVGLELAPRRAAVKN